MKWLSPSRIVIFIIFIVAASLYYILRLAEDAYFELRKYHLIETTETDTIYHQIPPFQFIAHTGDTVTNAFVENNVHVADFFFTRCPNICPEMTNALVKVQQALDEQQDFKILSFSVDPEYDSVPILARYAEKYKVDSKQWLLLTGDKKAIYDLAQNGYFISADDGDGQPVNFIHSDRLMLVDKEGIIRGYYHGTDADDVEDLITDAKLLLRYYRIKEREHE